METQAMLDNYEYDSNEDNDENKNKVVVAHLIRHRNGEEIKYNLYEG